MIAAQAWAKQHNVWIVIGSISPIEDGQQLPYNRTVVIDSEGKIASHYDKMHLFDVELASGESYMESARMVPRRHSSGHKYPIHGWLGAYHLLRYTFPTAI